ncbi:type II toxin-antitoxin system PemK/MazF family toxin [Archaeoglobus profundus]|uniref:Transcriptional modulator of MazE/toxin, MazF n=1 Tax=Archaeoglobus profundus (strain DSM 5631 / JCM 9629 / NBRC 100127 / Av18) TaxID=572546 RepID=D2RF40_ARCPA|nr:type II toxin-antitoxin system PemK/MazF family toxin [Archaeoglobus profundus]ADB58734.1 transcriptional modulator of MazE/toxin, MazF [Archaeoglobus profundus DSM 5631]
MQKTSSNFREGDVVVLELPFTDLIGKKLRPVLVLSSEKLNKISRDLIVAKISSSKQLEDFEVELKPEDLEEGKLKKISYIHCHSIFTVEKNLVLKKVGRVKDRKLSEVKSIIKAIFNLG